MRPLTDHMPKPLLQVGGRAILDHILDALALARIKNIIINAHYLGQQIIDHVKTRAVTISDERDAVLETGGGVRRALDHHAPLRRGPFLTLNADAIWRDGSAPMLGRLMQAFDADKMDALLLLQPLAGVTGSKNSGDYAMQPDGRVRFRGAAASAPFMFAGVTVTHPRLYDDAPANLTTGAFSQKILWDRAEAAGRLYGMVHDGDWFHASAPDDLKTINAAWDAAPQKS